MSPDPGGPTDTPNSSDGFSRWIAVQSVAPTAEGRLAQSRTFKSGKPSEFRAVEGSPKGLEQKILILQLVGEIRMSNIELLK
ncbi:uncharacterized protein EAF01_004223 [Botrytis porri]|uniref:uncharacterized protein n=1 Tax=Botrytis porri TaxID=87229 RepID=UPI0019004B65|nr:uncharacterized protein EAF01_004223 [Botrytis porri]KAF7908468.1 hypothetical protein EAF01_004223 [Botrytis porri]